MQSWSDLAPKKDFFESFVSPLLAGQEMTKQRLQNQAMQQEMPYITPQLEAALLGQNLMNQERQTMNKYAAPSAEAALMSKMLSNKTAEYNLQQAPQQDALQQALIRSQIANQNRMNQESNTFNPLSAPGVAGQVAIAEMYKQQGRPDLAKAIMDNLGSSNNSDLNVWRSTPLNIRRDLIAAARGIGYDEAEATQAFASGKSLEQLAADKGISSGDISKYQRIYGPSPQSINQAQQRTAADKELDFLGQKFVEWTEPYVTVGTIGNYSPTQLVDMIKGENKDKQAKFLAASVIYPDLAMLRLRLGMGESGITAVEEMKKASLGQIKVFEKGIDREIFTKMNGYVNDALGEAAALANQAIYNPEIAAKEAEEKYGIGGGNKEKKSEMDVLSDEELEKIAAE